jgi:O-antigen ligase
MNLIGIKSMKNIFNYLISVFQDLKSESKQTPLFLPTVLVLISIPLGYAMGSIAVGLFVFITLINFKKSNVIINKNLILPIVLYCLMLISTLWSSNLNDTFKALSKTIPFLLIPICFLVSPKFSDLQKQKTLFYFSTGMVLFAIYYLVKAIIRYAFSQNPDVFFYHELVTEDVNAIHVSVFMTVACFYYITKAKKSLADKLAIVTLMVLIVLLSSKNIILTFLVLLLVYYSRNQKSLTLKSIVRTSLFLIFLIVFILTGKIKDRFLIEIESNFKENTINQSIGNADNKVYNLSIKQAWSQEKFKANDYFTGTAFRVYQIRIFFELLQEDPIFFGGYGLNASQFRVVQKGIEHQVYLGDATHEGYQNKNFHNQYIQFFAELGIFGLLFLITMLAINLKNALKTKDFVSISFAALMISLFLTESFLSRQRGVVFFIMLYCLFSTTTISKKVK